MRRMKKFVPNWKVIVMTLLLFIFAILLWLDVRDNLFLHYLMVNIPAGWFVLNRLFPKSRLFSEEDKESQSKIYDFFEEPIFVIKFFIKLFISIVIGSVALPFISIVGITYLLMDKKSPEDPSKVQEEIMQHLQKKYGQKFEVVREVEYRHSSKYFVLEVRPKENRCVTFAGFKYINGKLEDNYPSQLWDFQLKKEIKPFICEMYPPQNRWDIYMNVLGAETLYEEIDNKNIPSYQEIRKQYPDKTSLKFKIYLFKDIDEYNMNEELEKIYRLIQLFREKGIQKYSMNIFYYEERLMEEKGRDIKVGAEFLEYCTHRISVTDKDAETVLTPKDLEKYLVEFSK